MFVNTNLIFRKNGVVVPPKVATLDLDYNTSHLFTKGDERQTTNEALRFVCCDNSHPDLQRHVTEVTKSVVDNPRDISAVPRRKSVDEALEMRNTKSSPGEPFRSKWTTFSEMYDAVGHDAFVDYINAFIALIENGGIDGIDPQLVVFETFLVHSKRDKYKLLKLLKETFRTIQGGSLTLQTLSDIFLSWAGKAVQYDPRCMTSFKSADYAQRYLSVVGYLFAVSLDFSGFDRAQSQNLVRMVIMAVCLASQLTPRMSKYFADTISAGALVLPNGMVLLRWGGNPSGHGLTTYVNCIVHLVMISMFREWCSTHLGRVPKFSELICGDDGNYGTDTKEDAEDIVKYFPIFCRETFGTSVGFEVNSEGSAVFQFPDMPIFLGRKLVVIAGTLSPLLVDTTRVLATIYNKTWNDDVERAEKYLGIYVSLAGWKILIIEGEADVPTDIRRFFADCPLIIGEISYATTLLYARGLYEINESTTLPISESSFERGITAARAVQDEVGLA